MYISGPKNVVLQQRQPLNSCGLKDSFNYIFEMKHWCILRAWATHLHALPLAENIVLTVVTGTRSDESGKMIMNYSTHNH